MEKLVMCRICLAKNVRMHVVVNKNLHELYEKLTDNPFVTEDSRPILACFFCCSKLNQCYRLLRKCLEAEELFAQMMKEDYETNSLINQNHLEFFSGFIISPIQHISIVDEHQIERITIKEELPAVCEGPDDIIEPKEEHQCDELEWENSDNSCLDVADILPHHSELNLEDDVPLMVFKTEEEEEQQEYKKKRRASEMKKLEWENSDNSCLDVAVILPHHSESDLEDDVPLIVFKTEVEEEEQQVYKKKRRASEMKRAAVAKKPKLDTRRTNLEVAVTAAEQTKKDKDLKGIRTTQKRTSKPGTYFNEPYKCDQRSFNRVKNKIQHTRTQIDVKSFICDVCKRSFSYKANLIHHFRIHTGEYPYKCVICQRSFRQKGQLTIHFRQHTGEKPYKCDVCQRSFSEKGRLTNHNRIHTGEKPYKCDVCQRSFSEKSGLSKHIRIHTGEKPYKCVNCQRSFKQKGQLTIHFRQHTGEKPYKCDVCQRSFSEKGPLKNHFRIHTGEKPYKCDVCQRSFSEKSGLSKHIRIHTGEKPYKCDFCQRSFSLKGYLAKHYRRHIAPIDIEVGHNSHGG